MCEFDSVSNVRKDRDVMHINFPRVVCTYGVEHVESRFFEYVFKLEECGMLVTFHNRIRDNFDSDHHAPAAMLKSTAKIIKIALHYVSKR